MRWMSLRMKKPFSTWMMFSKVCVTGYTYQWLAEWDIASAFHCMTSHIPRVVLFD